jgi:hypothetical protein
VDKLSVIFAALADPTRRAILDRLSRGEATVNELAKPFDLRLPSVSKHLKVLQRAGLVSQTRKANWRPRRLETAPLKEVARWSERFRGHREQRSGQKQFLCLICAETLMEQMSAVEAKRHLAQYRLLTDDLRKRGQLAGCNRLLPAETATTVRVRKGKVSITDGPFAETKELIGGYFLVEARDRAEALRIAARIPGARIGCVEVRPIADDPGTLHALGLVAPSTAA